MTKLYDPHAIELEVQKYWQKHATFKVTEESSKEKFYSLCMFPYPSGTLHMGHVRNYTLGDVIARYQRALGKNVMQPIGWDAFGLPAENAAMKYKISPAKWTDQNISNMRSQFKRLGFAYDWQREFATCEPEYYRWEQWFFTQLFAKGLVYKKNAVVNWDPVDNTVLANEQVINGRGWRSGALIERRKIPQWFIKITAYADELLADLEQLTEWPEQVITMQRNWIGRSHGTTITFKVAQRAEELKIFTTRTDTLMGVTYLALAPEHPLAQIAAENNTKLSQFIKKCSSIKVSEAALATLEKEGYTTGFHALHPVTQEALPIWVANFVMMDYGQGAVMAVPAHDQRDYEFAQLYQLPIKQVIQSDNNEPWDKNAALTSEGTLINSAQFSNLSSVKARQSITDYLIAQQLGEKTTHYRLRDWGISRQRYWGTPIPIINCPDCGTVAVPMKDLPVRLPENLTYNNHESPLKTNPAFYQTTCPKCQKPATRETDTFDTFVESSWYYARFACHNQNAMMLDDRANYWTPVDYYIGGIEHAILHLLYARFFHKLLRDEGLLNSDEPFKKLLTQGMVLKDGHKMSKSKGNVVDPEALIERYGADTVRLFIIFAAPPEQSLEWSDSGVEGAHRFLKRLWQFAQDYSMIKPINSSIDWQQATATQTQLRREIYQLLAKANYDYTRSQFNTVVSSGMKILNVLSQISATSQDPIEMYLVHDGFSLLLRLLAPITPHITHYLWQQLKYNETIDTAPWPQVVKEALQTTQLEYVIQINGKLRSKIKVANDAKEDTITTIAKTDANVMRFIQETPIKKIIIIKHRQLINIVL